MLVLTSVSLAILDNLDSLYGVNILYFVLYFYIINEYIQISTDQLL